MEYSVAACEGVERKRFVMYLSPWNYEIRKSNATIIAMTIMIITI